MCSASCYYADPALQLPPVSVCLLTALSRLLRDKSQHVRWCDGMGWESRESRGREHTTPYSYHHHHHALLCAVSLHSLLLLPPRHRTAPQLLALSDVGMTAMQLQSAARLDEGLSLYSSTLILTCTAFIPLLPYSPSSRSHNLPHPRRPSLLPVEQNHIPSINNVRSRQVQILHLPDRQGGGHIHQSYTTHSSTSLISSLPLLPLSSHSSPSTQPFNALKPVLVFQKHTVS